MSLFTVHSSLRATFPFYKNGKDKPLIETGHTLIFDLGNIFIRVDPEESIRQMEQASSSDHEQILSYFTLSDTVRQYEKGLMSSEKFYNHSKRDLKLELSMSQFKILWLSMLSPFEPMIQWLNTIRNRYQIMALSNTNEWHIRHCEAAFPFMQWFRQRLYSCRLGTIKPEPDIYQKALSAADVPKEQVLFIDDRQENVNAAVALGIRSIHFTGYDSFQETWQNLNIHPKKEK
jgi:HAD superfamily hydrolase (TIGR01509 family)